MNTRKPETVVIAGAGTMGQQTALVCTLHGLDTVVYDISKDALATCKDRIRKLAPRCADFYGLPESDLPSALARISFTGSRSAAAERADILIESIIEDPEAKGSLFQAFDALCGPDTLFLTNTSSLVPSMFADQSGRPELLCALHFHDVCLTRIVDVMPHPGTAPRTLEAVEAFARRIGQIPIVLTREHNGYVFNSMLMALMDSALSLASGGITDIQDIDRSWMGIMHTASGPFGIMDSIGLDTVWKVTDYWARVRNQPKALANARFLKEYVDQGWLGRKTGQGFYTYPDPAFLEPGFMERLSKETSNG